MNGNPNTEFIQENNLKPKFHPVEFVDTLFPVYKQNKGGHQKTPSLLSTEDLLKWSSLKTIYLGMDDTLYPNCLLFKKNEFEHNLYL